MKKPTIILFDDENDMQRRYSEKLDSKTYDIEPISEVEFRTEVDALKERQKESRLGKTFEPCTKIDETSILIVDQDLISASEEFKFLTGESVAYLVRCYSYCGLIMTINQFGFNSFDLTLKGHPESFADVNIGGAQIDNPGLWGKSREGFRPWYWPEIPNFLKTYSQRISDALENLKKPILNTLGLDKPAIFPKSVGQFIGNDPAETTFEQFVFESDNGLQIKDKLNDPRLIARIAASRISCWLESIVLPGQDILVDAPHLVSRYPSLLIGDHSQRDLWNKTTAIEPSNTLPLDQKKLEKYKFQKEFWLSRPAWLGKELIRSQEIDEISKPWKKEDSKFLFCEDSSTFEKKETCAEFDAEVDSPYNQRYVHAIQFKDVSYSQKFRLLK
ncbi:hypothetical protein MUP77_19725 [Candidatus Bathyarchaeota archaeon]|nr:hypothetical protein [Candidatus Bathyarchaeota archaeon]